MERQLRRGLRPPKPEVKDTPYNALWRGEKVLRSNLVKFAPETLSAVDILTLEGRIVGEPKLFPDAEDDELIWMPEFQPKPTE